MTLQEYQHYGGIVIFCIWIYIAIQLIRDTLNFRKVAAEKNIEVFKYFSYFKLREVIKKDKELDAVHKIYRRRGLKLFILWILVGIIFTIGAAIIKTQV